MFNLYYFIPFAIALILSAIFTPLVKRLAWRWQIVDYPTPRKIHQKPIPLLGGLGIFLSFTFTTLIFWFQGKLVDINISNTYIAAILIAGLTLVIGGVLDDRYNLKPYQQFIFPLVAVLIALLAGIKIQYITNPAGGVLKFPLGTGIILAGFWLIGMVYTTKFLDGLDGLVAGVTVIGAIIIFIVSLSWDVKFSGTSTLSLILAGAALGFLIFNWHPAKIFLGEGGSIFCGFMLGVLAIISGSKIATALLIMGIPILDVFWVIIRRLWQGNSLAKADRKHLHFRLLDIGLSHRQAVLFLLFLTTAFGITSLFLKTKGKIIALVILSLIMIILATSLVLIYKIKCSKKSVN